MTTTDLDNAAREIAALAQQAMGLNELTPGEIYLVHRGDGSTDVVDLTGDQYRDQPARKTGTARVRDVDSFTTYWAKHRIDGASEIYADRDSCTLAAVLDAHSAEAAGWAQHRIILGLRHSEAWKTWAGYDRKMLDQEPFAEHIELNLADIREPAAATMLEIAQTMSGAVKADWQSGITLANGARRLAYIETASASAGAKGDLVIPKELLLGLPVFDGADVADPVRALFRYRINGGKLQLGYIMDRPVDVISAAFEGVVAAIAATTGQPVLRGTPLS